MKRTVRLPADVLAVAVAAATSSHLFAAESTSVEQRLKSLEAQNQLLRNELTAHKQLINDLNSHLNPPPGGRRSARIPLSAQGGSPTGVKGLPPY